MMLKSEYPAIPEMRSSMNTFLSISSSFDDTSADATYCGEFVNALRSDGMSESAAYPASFSS